MWFILFACGCSLYIGCSATASFFKGLAAKEVVTQVETKVNDVIQDSMGDHGISIPLNINIQTDGLSDLLKWIIILVIVGLIVIGGHGYLLSKSHPPDKKNLDKKKK